MGQRGCRCKWGSKKFDSFDHNSIQGFLFAFQLVWKTNELHRGAALWLLHFFMKLLVAAGLHAPIILNSKSHKRKKQGTVVSYRKAVNYLLWPYTTDDIIVKQTPISCDALRCWMNSAQSRPKGLWNKALRCYRVYDEYKMKGDLVEGLSESICSRILPIGDRKRKIQYLILCSKQLC